MSRIRKTRYWVGAPPADWADAPAMLGVYLAEGESVQWFWTHTAQGSYVSGYAIMPLSEANHV